MYCIIQISTTSIIWYICNYKINTDR